MLQGKPALGQACFFIHRQRCEHFWGECFIATNTDDPSSTADPYRSSSAHKRIRYAFLAIRIVRGTVFAPAGSPSDRAVLPPKSRAAYLIVAALWPFQHVRQAGISRRKIGMKSALPAMAATLALWEAEPDSAATYEFTISDENITADSAVTSDVFFTIPTGSIFLDSASGTINGSVVTGFTDLRLSLRPEHPQSWVHYCERHHLQLRRFRIQLDGWR